MRRGVLAFVMAALLGCVSASAAEIGIPDACRDGLCFTGLHWKKGFLEHTLSGFIGPEVGLAESVHISLLYRDGKNVGSGHLSLKMVTPHTPFNFKILSNSVNWEKSTVSLTASAILGIQPVEKDGIACHFASLGSRLAVSISNATEKDLVLDYRLLTLTSGGKNYKMNGNHGKYTDQAIPNSPTLIAAGTEQKEEFIVVGSASFEDGQWNEDWRLHLALMGGNPTLTLPLGPERLEKIPLEVRLVSIMARGTGPKAN